MVAGKLPQPGSILLSHLKEILKHTKLDVLRPVKGNLKSHVNL